MIIPSIDLINGKAVQLRQGREKVLERDNPLELAEEFDRYGAIAVVDLDAAFAQGQNETTIGEICARNECRVGGGIRSLDKAKRILSLGAAKIIIGTMALKDGRIHRDFLEELAASVGRERIIIALDSCMEKIVTGGWRIMTGLSCDSVLKELEPYASEFLLTRVDKEGMMRGTDLEYFKRLRSLTDTPMTAAGGISAVDEIAFLSDYGISAQLGMALYTGKIRLPEAFISSLKWRGNEWIPTVTVDSCRQVLMLAYSSRESLEKTFETGNVWYFSRSRNSLWMKGETSGHVQRLVRARSDCDGDALLITAEQEGFACHAGRYSCFGEREFSLEQLWNVIKNRLDNPSPESYTARLDESLVGEKIREEACELIEAERQEDIIWEAADLLYFLMVLLVRNRIPLRDVFRELGRRRDKRKFDDLKRFGGLP